jgi:hypothetical protein
MNKIFTATLIIAATYITGCATTPEAKLKQAYKRVSKTPFSEQPAIYIKLEQEGKINGITRNAWTEAWAVKNKEQEEQIAANQREQQRLAEQRRQWLASLTPAQRFDLEMRERELQQQQATMVLQHLSNTHQRQQEVQAYNERTRVLQQPVNVNINGTVNHNIDGRINVYGY